MYAKFYCLFYWLLVHTELLPTYLPTVCAYILPALHTYCTYIMFRLIEVLCMNHPYAQDPLPPEGSLQVSNPLVISGTYGSKSVTVTLTCDRMDLSQRSESIIPQQGCCEAIVFRVEFIQVTTSDLHTGI